MNVRDIVFEVLQERCQDVLSPERMAEVADAVEQAIREEWEEVPIVDAEMGYTASLELVDVCLIDRLLNEGYELQVYRSKRPVRPRGVLERTYVESLKG